MLPYGVFFKFPEMLYILASQKAFDPISLPSSGKFEVTQMNISICVVELFAVEKSVFPAGGLNAGTLEHTVEHDFVVFTIRGKGMTVYAVVVPQFSDLLVVHSSFVRSIKPLGDLQHEVSVSHTGIIPSPATAIDRGPARSHRGAFERSVALLVHTGLEVVQMRGVVPEYKEVNVSYVEVGIFRKRLGRQEVSKGVTRRDAGAVFQQLLLVDTPVCFADFFLSHPFEYLGHMLWQFSSDKDFYIVFRIGSLHRIHEHRYEIREAISGYDSGDTKAHLRFTFFGNFFPLGVFDSNSLASRGLVAHSFFRWAWDFIGISSPSS